MAITALQLPVDIPWKRLCVSEDMIDKKVCDRQFPFRWRTSLAVLSYEPPEEVQAYEGMIVSYLKVVCTITGFQPDPEEVGVKNRKVYSSWSDPVVIDNYKDVVNKYYGSYGAIVQVAIAPQDAVGRDEFDVASSPYFADFEPKKRELYELVSETGELMSRSLENINVRKGTTTTDSHEVLDIFGGASAQGSYAGTGGGASITGQWGTKDVNQTEYTNIRTSDQAREMRETFSHTTQLTQMYHQLDSYHVATNRAVFFLVPRPHIVQSEFTFVNGPRLLEGIQELFLVVMRPKDTPEPCVEASLETAHIASIPIFTYETSTATLTLHVAKQAEDTSGGFGDDSSTTYAETSETYTPPDGWEVDIDRDGGFKIESASGDRVEVATVSSVARDHVTAYGKVSAWFEDRTWPQSNVSHNGVLDMVVTVYIRKKKPTVSGYTQALYITGRGVCCCGDGYIRPGDWILWEKPLQTHRLDAAVGREAVMPIQEANQMRSMIANELRQSLNDADRYPAGVVGFAESQIVGSVLGQLVRNPDHPDNLAGADLAYLPDEIRRKVLSVSPHVSRGRLLTTPLPELADRFGLDREEVITLRRAAVGIEGPEPEPGRRYDPAPAIPDVTGQQLENALRVLERAGLSVANVEEIDSPLDRHTVVSQYPRPGLVRREHPVVDLVIASGLSVTLPSVVGQSLGDALERLAEAGLRREPTIVRHPATQRTEGEVLQMTPMAGTSVTPGAEVVLVVATDSEPSKGEAGRF
jgi:hypothetical protein